MRDIKRYFWIFPTFGVIFGIITFLVPVLTLSLSAYDYSMDWNYWIWGLSSYSQSYSDPYYMESISSIEFTNNTSLLTSSLISTIMIAVGVIALLIASINSKRHTSYKKNIMTMTGFGAILLILGGIIFYIGADWPTTKNTGPGPPGVSVWSMFDQGFGVFTPFIGGIISLLGTPVYFYFFKYRVEGSVSRKDIILKIEDFKEKIDQIYNLEVQIEERISNLEAIQKQILNQMADLRENLVEKIEIPPL